MLFPFGPLSSLPLTGRSLTIYVSKVFGDKKVLIYELASDFRFLSFLIGQIFYHIKYLQNAFLFENTCRPFGRNVQPRNLKVSIGDLNE